MITVQNISKAFGSHKVLEDISFDVAQGEVICLIGPSGSGKSTILRCINGLETYDAGEIRVDGVRVDSSKPSIRALRSEIGMVFQRFNLFPHRTALENVMEGPIYVKGVPRAQAREHGIELLEKVGLGAKINAYPEKLSGGQQQRVAIARALAMRPKAILFDEPTSGLDPELVGDVLKVMMTLAHEGMTMVLVTHEMAFAAAVATRVLFLDRGHIVEQGPAAQILKAPQQERTQLFLQRVLQPIAE